MPHLSRLTAPDLEAMDRPGLLLPLGSCEQHGPHLPVNTDARIATAVAARVAEARPNLVVAPTLPYGASGEHQGLAGTISIGLEALELVVVETARTLGPEFSGLVLFSWHGGNMAALQRAVQTIRTEGRRVLHLIPRVHGDAHAGRMETSIMLALHPELVRMNLAAPGDTRPLAEIMNELRVSGVAGVSPTGVLGDPTGAGAEEGEELLSSLVADLGSQIDEWEAS